MPANRVLVLTAAAALAAAAVLAGCSSSSGSGSATASPVGGGGNGIQDKTAAQIVAAAGAAAKAASAVHITGTAAGIGIDARIGTDVADATVKQNGQTYRVLRIADAYYVFADKATWTAQVGAATAAKLAGKWVKLNHQQAGSSYDEFLSIPTFFAALDSGDPATKGEQTTLDGVKVIGIKDTKDASTLYVSEVGKPLPLKAVEATGGGSLTFADWNVPLTGVTAPAAATVVDLSNVPSG